jgi:RNA polymerase sigma-70 factor (ECF subfamily)
VSDAEQKPAAQPFRELFRCHALFVWRVLRRHGVADAELEDLCQDVFVVVHRRLREFEGRSSLRTWIYEIARRSALAHARKRMHAPRLVAEMPELRDSARGPDATLEHERDLRWLEASLARLSDEQREAFVLYELEEMTLAEVAEAQGCALNTAHYRVSCAREELRALAACTTRDARPRRAQGGP